MQTVVLRGFAMSKSRPQRNKIVGNDVGSEPSSDGVSSADPYIKERASTLKFAAATGKLSIIKKNREFRTIEVRW